MAKTSVQAGAVKKRVALGKMHALSRHAQREKLNESRVSYLLSNFDPDYLGTPVLSEREDGSYYILDGHHRIEATKRWLGDGWETQFIDCQVFLGLTDADEAKKFIALNNRLAVSAMDKFRAAVVAGLAEEVAINAIVKEASLCVSKDKVPGAIGAVSTLTKIYRRSDGDVLARSLRIIRDAYGDAGFEAKVIDGIGHLCQRYNGTLDEQVAIAKLGGVHGGVKGLLGRSEVLHKQTGNAKAQCVAAAAVDVINSGRSGRKLPGWWRA